MTRTTTHVIEVRGRLPAVLAEELSTFDQEADDVTTVLSGQIVDTAALYGLLARLESFGVALISIRPVPYTSKVH